MVMVTLRRNRGISKVAPRVPRYVGSASRWITNTYLVAYSIHLGNRVLHRDAEGKLAEKDIDIHLEDMGGLLVLPFLDSMGGVWIVEGPPRARSPIGLRDNLRKLLLPGDELLVVPINRPDRVTGVEIDDALQTLRERYEA